MGPFYERDGITIYCGDCLEVMPRLEGPFDAVMTDPPYSSGGQFRSDRMNSTIQKYIQTDSLDTWRVPFTGDNRDQRGFLIWCSMWMGKARHLTRPGGILLTFTDWRQLPAMTDAMQCGGWVWRGIATWWKPGIRMQRGRFSLSAEYIVFGSNGDLSEGEHSPQNVLRCKPIKGNDKNHIAEKPVQVLTWALGITPANSVILDPFMGSGTTLMAARNEGRRAVGIEISEEYCRIAVERLRQRTLWQIENVKAAPAPEQGKLQASLPL